MSRSVSSGVRTRCGACRLPRPPSPLRYRCVEGRRPSDRPEIAHARHAYRARDGGGVCARPITRCSPFIEAPVEWSVVMKRIPLAIERWESVASTRDFALLDELLADDVVFASPIVHTPQVGRAITTR